jgi:hypothetical protein
MKILKYHAYQRFCLLLFTGLTLIVSSCKQGFDRLIPEGTNNDSIAVSYGNPKVLYIIVDGARGLSVRDAKSPNLTALLPKSIYSWVSLSDEEATAPGTNWADMLTGVGKSKHNVINNDFSANKLSTFPVIYKRAKDAGVKNIQVFTTSAVFKDNLTSDADQSELLASDALVKDKVISSLADESANFITAHFSSVDAAGAKDGYDLTIPGYQSAIVTFDTYVGEMMAALQKRPNYDKESWMVIVTSSRGGHFAIPPASNDNTIFSNPDINTFTIMYSSRYKTRFIGKPYLGNRYQGDFLKFNGQIKAQVTAGGNSLYNLGDEAFTIEIKIKKNPGPDNDYKFFYPAIVGKRPEWSSGWASNGWVIFLEDDQWQFNARGTKGGEQVRGNTLADATWNSLAVVGVIRDNRRYARTFTNGVFNNERDITDWGNLDNNSLLTLGYIAGNGHREPDAYLSDLRIWKAALPDSVISRFACDTYVDSSHPYYSYLAGYWPVVGGTDNIIHDEGPFGSNMTYSAEAKYERLAEYLCAPSIDNLGSLVPRNVDIPSQIISWFKIPRQESWQLDGRVWLDQ